MNNWKTSVGGVAIASFTLLQNGASWKIAVSAFLTGLLGLWAHDPKKVAK